MMSVRTRRWRAVAGAAVLAGLLMAALGARYRAPAAHVVKIDFESGLRGWKFTDASAWRIEEVDGNHVLHQFKQSKYKPPHRSPLNMALLENIDAGDFTLTARVRSTTRDYPHRDVCVFFGYQDPAHFYYVHFGKRADDHANQIFIVNDAPRTKISETSTAGTPWTDDWHTVRVVRDISDGRIEVYFDDMSKPIMTAHDKTFAHGRVGIGSFDDTAQWDDIKMVYSPAEPQQ